MAFVHGKNSYFAVDDTGGTLRDITAFTNDVSFSRPVDMAETTTFGDSDKEYIVGLRDATISTSGLWDATLDGYLAGDVGDSDLEWAYGPAGSTGGNVKYTHTSSTNGIVHLTSYDISGSIGDAVSWSAEFQISGTPSRTTF